jgi:hypothetical protein
MPCLSPPGESRSSWSLRSGRSRSSLRRKLII